MTLSETADDDYETTTSIDNAGSVSGNSVSMPLTKDYEVEFTNKLKSYPVTIKLVDQDGQANINGMFSLASTIGSLGTDLYASSSNEGVFYTSDKFWVDTYTLSQTITAQNYIGLTAPVTLRVTGTGIESSDPVNVVVEGDPENGYVITVINRATKVISVRKVLKDPLLTSTRSFGFAYSYIPKGETTPVTETFNLQPVSNNTDGASYELVVPIHATDLTVTEVTTGDYSSISDIYNTKVKFDKEAGSTGTEADGTCYSISEVEEDGTITFTNTRKTIQVTVVKTVDGKGGTFNFEAFLKNGSIGIPNYQLRKRNPEDTSLEELEPELITGSGENAGKASFSLTVETNNHSNTVLTIPYGAVLTLTEQGSEEYLTSVGVGSETPETGLSIDLGADKTTENLTVTFTNKEVHVAPTAYLNRKKLFRRLLLMSLLLGSMAALPVWYRKRRNGGGDDEM